MRKYIVFVFALIVCLSLIPFSFAEDYSIYTTEHLLKMKADIEAELERRSAGNDNDKDKPIFENEYVSIKLLKWITDGNLMQTTFSVSVIGDHYCLIAPNATEKMMSVDDGFSTLKKLKDMSSGGMGYACSPGSSHQCEFTWDLGNVYNRSFYGMIFSDLPLSSVTCPVPEFPLGNHIGITCIVAPFDLDPNTLLFGAGSYDINLAQLFDIQIIPADAN